MITVYAILSEVNGSIYVGVATDADKRLKEHNAGKAGLRRGTGHGELYTGKYKQTGQQHEEERYILNQELVRNFLKHWSRSSMDRIGVS